jgi:xylulokinase
MYLGIDLGTGSVKALLIDEGGRTVAEASRAYAVSSPVPGHAESAPADWWTETVAAVRACCAGRGDAVRGIGLSGQAHGLVVLGAQEKPLRPAILWADQRATAEMDAVLALPEDIRRPLANPVVSDRPACRCSGCGRTSRPPTPRSAASFRRRTGCGWS